MKRRPVRGLVVSDLHCGSSWALCPPRFAIESGVIIDQSNLMRMYWHFWNELRRYTKSEYGQLDFLIVNGDAIDGDHHRTLQVWSKNLGDHLRAAHHALQPLAELARRVYIVLGTESHTGSLEHALANLLGADRQSKQRPAHDRLTLDVDGVRICAVHHMPSTSRAWLRGNALGMELANHRLHAAEVGDRIPDVLCLAHRHQFGLYHDHAGVVLSTPSWQGPTRYVYRVAPAARWQVGAAFIHVEAGHAHVEPYLRRPAP